MGWIGLGEYGGYGKLGESEGHLSSIFGVLFGFVCDCEI